MEKSVRIWAKLISDGKVVRDVVYTGAMFYDEDSFHAAVRNICDTLDIATPVLLKTHIFNFAKFNHVNFLPRDFVEQFDYDRLVLENIIV